MSRSNFRQDQGQRTVSRLKSTDLFFYTWPKVMAKAKKRTTRSRREQQEDSAHGGGGGVGGNAEYSTEEVDDDAAVGAAAGGLAEEGHPVGPACGGERLGRAVDDEVAGVGQRVAEAEDGLVRLLAPAGRGESRRRRKEQQRGDEEQRAPAPGGTRRESGHLRRKVSAAGDHWRRVVCGRREKRLLPCVARALICFAFI
jgi:hypothetical protein